MEAVGYLNDLNQDDIIVNIQGDEPLLEPEMVDELIKPFLDDEELVMSTLKSRITEEEEVNNVNVVKVATAGMDLPLYFSRWPLPYNRNGIEVSYYKHIDYTPIVWILVKYTKLKQTPWKKPSLWSN